jgi:electron transport complex protein RnfC
MMTPQHFKEKGRFSIDISMKLDAINKPFQEVPPPDEAVVFLRQHVGSANQPLVKKGESVEAGQKVGDARGDFAVPVHSPVTGTVKMIRQVFNPISREKEQALVITTEDADLPLKEYSVGLDELNRERIIEKVRESGIVGLGGAAFPTHIKLSAKNIDHLIINAKESDPNLACDVRLMLDRPESMVDGIKLMARALDTRDIVVATRTEKGELGNFEELLRENNIRMVWLHPSYSVGSERLLVKEVLNREVPSGRYPPDVGVVVHNVATAYAVARAVLHGEPLISRGLTFYSEKTGGRNLWSRMGTPAGHVMNYLEISPENVERVIFGSIMMGNSIPDWSVPTSKYTSGITVFTPAEPDPYRRTLPCIRCGYCNTVCPVDIYPQLIMEADKKGDRERLRRLHVEDCINCGLCSYVCPSTIRLTGYLQSGKRRIE